MDISTLWCAEQEFDETGEVVCMAHLAEGKAPNCPYKTPLDREEAEYPCSDYKLLSRLAEILGMKKDEEIEIEEEWGVVRARVHDGVFETQVGGFGFSSTPDVRRLCCIINHPEKIVRTSTLTEEEMERCRLFHAIYISRDPNGFSNNFVKLWSAKPVREARGLYVEDQTTRSSLRGNASCELFPSIHPGECVRVPNLERR